jgi:glutamate formiminotransferase / 5-formyltetrahydrofolate cyclo-ligase
LELWDEPRLPVLEEPGETGPRPVTDVLECVVNVSEGCDEVLLANLAGAAGECLLDVHSDCDHHRSVLTLAGPDDAVQAAARELARAAVGLLDLRAHEGAHPRFGVLDVVPWVALEGWPLHDVEDGGSEGCGKRARQARDSFALWAATELALPVFLYGSARSLPEVRKEAWLSLWPDFGPSSPHPTAGAVAVGCRPLMLAYNLWLAETDIDRARAAAAAVRSPHVRALAFALGEHVQVSCNLLAPGLVGPAAIWDQVSELATIARAELVGLAPERVLLVTPEQRWYQLDLALDRTIESRLRLRPQI